MADNDARLTIRLPADTLARLEAESRRLNRSHAWIIRSLLTQELAEPSPTPAAGRLPGNREPAERPPDSTPRAGTGPAASTTPKAATSLPSKPERPGQREVPAAAPSTASGSAPVRRARVVELNAFQTEGVDASTGKSIPGTVYGMRGRTAGALEQLGYEVVE